MDFITYVYLCLCAFQDNTHRLTLSMSPDEKYLEKQAEAEEHKLHHKTQNLTDVDLKDIYEKGAMFFKFTII